jgi:hypothetical protein
LPPLIIPASRVSTSPSSVNSSLFFFFLPLAMDPSPSTKGGDRRGEKSGERRGLLSPLVDSSLFFPCLLRWILRLLRWEGTGEARRVAKGVDFSRLQSTLPSSSLASCDGSFAFCDGRGQERREEWRKAWTSLAFSRLFPLLPLPLAMDPSPSTKGGDRSGERRMGKGVESFTSL